MEHDQLYRCCNCGKIFSTKQRLDSHKNRKTSCLMMEKPDDATPYCVHCNRAFANNGNLRRHLPKCRAKNKQVDTFVEKTKYAQELEENIKQLEEKQKQLLEQLNDKSKQPQEELIEIIRIPIIVLSTQVSDDEVSS